MRKIIITLILFNIVLSGCATREQLKNSEKKHLKASAYYKSIGQDVASKEEQELANQDKKESSKLITLVADILTDFFK